MDEIKNIMHVMIGWSVFLDPTHVNQECKD